MSKFRYQIIPSGVYTISINGIELELTGEEILNMIWSNLDDGK